MEKLEGIISVSSNKLPEGNQQLKIEVKEAKISPMIAETIIQGGGMLHSIRVETPTLEDVLIKLTGEK